MSKAWVSSLKSVPCEKEELISLCRSFSALSQPTNRMIRLFCSYAEKTSPTAEALVKVRKLASKIFLVEDTQQGQFSFKIMDFSSPFFLKEVCYSDNPWYEHISRSVQFVSEGVSYGVYQEPQKHVGFWKTPSDSECFVVQREDEIRDVLKKTFGERISLEQVAKKRISLVVPAIGNSDFNAFFSGVTV